jgi:hypothetical protein
MKHFDGIYHPKKPTQRQMGNNGKGLGKQNPIQDKVHSG